MTILNSLIVPKNLKGPFGIVKYLLCCKIFKDINKKGDINKKLSKKNEK